MPPMLRGQKLDTVFKCRETKRWKDNFLYNKRLNINEVTSFKKIINCNNVFDVKNVEKVLNIKLYSNGTTKLGTCKTNEWRL
jgi:hypothetical protein